MKNSHRFFRNTECKYFPCHKTDAPEDFNCLFCFCPLYAMGDKCGGDYTYVGKNRDVKSCANCVRAHRYEFYDYVISKLKEGSGT